MRTKQATFIFWVDKGSLKIPKMVNLASFEKLKLVTRHVNFNSAKYCGKCQNEKLKWDILGDFHTLWPWLDFKKYLIFGLVFQVFLNWKPRRKLLPLQVQLPRRQSLLLQQHQSRLTTLRPQTRRRWRRWISHPPSRPLKKTKLQSLLCLLNLLVGPNSLLLMLKLTRESKRKKPLKFNFTVVFFLLFSRPRKTDSILAPLPPVNESRF